jgi:ceramide glucosyltransferase
MHLEWLDFPAALLFLASVAGLLYLGTSAWAIHRLVSRVVPCPPRMAAAAATLLKPLKGADAQLYDNLYSFCMQDFATYQIVFGVADADDPAIAVVHRLISEFPDRDMTLVVGGLARAANRKIANLENMMAAVRHDLLVLSDSDMRVAPHYLATVTAPLAEPGVGLVTCLYRGIPQDGLWSEMASLYLNQAFLPQAALAEALGVGNGAFGATLAFSRQTLAAAGGFAAFANYLADDHELGVAVRKQGLRVVLSPLLVDNYIHEPGFEHLFRHELRWAMTIRTLSPVGHAGTIITHPVALAFLGLLLYPAPWPLAIFLTVLLIRAALVRLGDRMLKVRPTPYYLIPLRDGLSFAIFIASFIAQNVTWRGHRYRVCRDGRLFQDGDRRA